MKNEIEQIAQQNEMSIEFVTWFFAEKKAGCGNAWFMIMAAAWEGWKGRSIEMDKLAAENVSMRKILGEVIYSSEEVEHDGYLTFVVSPDSVHDAADLLEGETPTTDRIVAGIKADAKSHDLNAFISHYSAELDEHIANGGDLFDATSIRLRCFIVGGRMFREKLRDEDKALALREGAK